MPARSAEHEPSGAAPEREQAAPGAVPAAPVAIDIIGMQQSAGNAAVTRMLARTSTSALLEQGARAVAGGGPGLALRAYMAKDRAWKNAADYVGYGDHLGPADALRHCTWSGLVMQAALEENEDKPGDPWVDDISRILPKAMGSPESRAWEVLMAHEHAEGGAGTKDSKMDQSNNATGIAMASALWRAGRRSPDDIVNEARAYLDGGKLTMFDKSGSFIPTGDWRTFPKDTWELGKYLDGHANPIPQPPPKP